MIHMQEYSYSGWRINCLNGEASRLLPDNELIKIQLLKIENTVFHEGWWPSPPKNKKPKMITGICLWDARWQIEFAQINKCNPPARPSFCLHADRKKIIAKIQKGACVTKVHYPSDLGIYHHTLIKWQLEKIYQFCPKNIFYHLPTKEYHDHIKILESLLGKSLGLLHVKLDYFVESLIAHIKSLFGTGLMKKIEFISPYSKGTDNPLDSYLLPYKHPEKFGINKEEAFGVEDLSEVRLAHAAWKKNGGEAIPVLGGVIGSQSYYYGMKTLDNTSFIKV
jgi:hypothetical protein